jgi:cytochrome P450
MMEYPDVLKKAQLEIDNVVGTSRLPTFEDRPLLPYIDAVMNECLRWGAPVPLSTSFHSTCLRKFGTDEPFRSTTSADGG